MHIVQLRRMSRDILQFMRFGIVGLLSNLTLYILFVLLVEIGVDQMVVLVLLYTMGISITFYFNKNWSFAHGGDLGRTALLYIALYASLCCVNIFSLHFFVDFLGLSYMYVQAAVIVVFVPIVFFVQRKLIFSQENSKH